MHHPRLIDEAYLASLAAPNETHAIRLILPVASSNKPYTVHGKNHRIYMFRYDPILCFHKLDVPFSVWTRGVPENDTLVRAKENTMPFDLFHRRPTAAGNIIPLMIHWKGYVAPAPDTPTVRIHELPEAIAEAAERAARDEGSAEHRPVVDPDSVIDPREPEIDRIERRAAEDAERKRLQNAERQRQYRERKKEAAEAGVDS